MKKISKIWIIVAAMLVVAIGSWIFSGGKTRRSNLKQRK